MRAIPLLKDFMNTFVVEDTKRILARQAAFNDVDSSLGDQNPRFSSSFIKKLRDMIMEIRQKDVPTLPLFCSVDQLRFNRTTFVFTCTPVVESEARNIVSSLAAFLKHKYGEEVIGFGPGKPTGTKSTSASATPTTATAPAFSTILMQTISS